MPRASAGLKDFRENSSNGLSVSYGPAVCCPNCSSSNWRGAGLTSSGIQRWRCQVCKRNIQTRYKEKVFDNMWKTESLIMAGKLLLEGYDCNAAAKISHTGKSR